MPACTHCLSSLGSVGLIRVGLAQIVLTGGAGAGIVLSADVLPRVVLAGVALDGIVIAIARPPQVGSITPLPVHSYGTSDVSSVDIQGAVADNLRMGFRCRSYILWVEKSIRNEPPHQTKKN